MSKKIYIIGVVALVFGIILISSFWIMNRTKIDIVLSNNTGQESIVAQSNITTSPNIAQTASDSNFSFAVQADPHMDEQSDAATYKQALENIVKAKPDFLIDLGDIFMVDKLVDKSVVNIRNRYELMKGYYDLLGSIPLYFAMGNHDGETGWDSLNTKSYRASYFPTETYDKNYYSFERDNTLFIILDPYTYTSPKPNSNGWGWTLGKAQYDWLKETLEKSDAKYKFVFMHQLVGGDNQGRGGIEFAKLYEWGGNNSDGSYGFDAKRPGWGKPIHKLLADNSVSAVFKGHDHLFVKQELDGMVYQTVPQPSHLGDKIDTAKEYGYISGEIIGGSGYLCVVVSDTKITVQFIKADDSQTVGYSYNIE